MSSQTKSPLLVLLPVAFLLLLIPALTVSWVSNLGALGMPLAIAAAFSTTIWLLLLWWGFHHLAFQIASLFARPETFSSDEPLEDEVRFIVLYLTCDDFQSDSFSSCLKQEYPKDLQRVLIGDDSATGKHRDEIDVFLKDYPGVELSRRGSRAGFKAGNINTALSEIDLDASTWVILVDADQILPEDYLATMADAIRRQPQHVAFVQGVNEPDHTLGNDPSGPTINRKATHFQRAMGVGVRLFYSRELTCRPEYGFVPLLGHGAAIRGSALRALNGFPRDVSEDYAFALAARQHDLFGVLNTNASAWESFPKDFGAYLVRLRKSASGTADLLKGHLGPFVFSGQSRASLVERMDAFMLLAWYFVIPFAFINVYVTSWLCSQLFISTTYLGVVHPLLPYVFLVVLAAGLPALVSVSQSVGEGFKAWFWSTAVTTSALPWAIWWMMVGLWKPPLFLVTPKGRARSETFPLASTLIALLGVGTIALSAIWRSPFSAFIAGHGVAFFSFPLFHKLNTPSFSGRIARAVVYIPGFLYLYALYEMWTLARF